jgi:hypothetical protein
MTNLRTRSGALLAEAVISLTLGLLVIGAFAAALAASTRWISRLLERAEALDLVHFVWAILDEELRPGVPGRDWRVQGEGEWVELRAFRGIGRVCASDGDLSAWSIAYQGRREAEPGRDSVLVLGADGGWRTFALEGAQDGGACEARAGETSQRWAWEQGSAPAPVLVRLFENGEYHLAEGALRYRRGGGGRQPLTPERLGGGSRFQATAGGLEIVLELVAPGGGSRELFRWGLRGTPNDPGSGASGT